MTLLSHPAEPKKGKTATKLLDHLVCVGEKARDIAARSNFENKDLMYYTGLLHDLGKLGPYYQKLFSEPEKMKENKPMLARDYDDFHSIYSRWIAEKILGKKRHG